MPSETAISSLLTSTSLVHLENYVSFCAYIYRVLVINLFKLQYGNPLKKFRQIWLIWSAVLYF